MTLASPGHPQPCHRSPSSLHPRPLTTSWQRWKTSWGTMATTTGGTSECLRQDTLLTVSEWETPASHRDILGFSQEDTPAVGRTAGPGSLYVCPSVWIGTIWLLLCSRPRSQKRPRERSGGCGWGCCGAGIAHQGQNLGCPCWWQWPSASSWMELCWALRREQPCSCQGSVYLQHRDRKRMQKACFL